MSFCHLIIEMVVGSVSPIRTITVGPEYACTSLFYL